MLIGASELALAPTPNKIQSTVSDQMLALLEKDAKELHTSVSKLVRFIILCHYTMGTPEYEQMLRERAEGERYGTDVA